MEKQKQKQSLTTTLTFYFIISIHYESDYKYPLYTYSKCLFCSPRTEGKILFSRFSLCSFQQKLTSPQFRCFVCRRTLPNKEAECQLLRAQPSNFMNKLPTSGSNSSSTILTNHGIGNIFLETPILLGTSSPHTSTNHGIGIIFLKTPTSHGTL